ncbi:MAG: hypothetical protein CMO26_02215 [Thiotrichales bacterium]|nr:hypothetical protein [Thiotrichales bacterium]
MPDFQQPVWLLLLAAVPLLYWVGVRAPLPESRFKRIAGSTLRCLAASLLLVALAGPLKGSRTDQVDVMFVLDVSRSVGRDSIRRGLDVVNRAIREKSPAGRMGLIAFGDDAATELLLRESIAPIEEISVHITRTGTNIAHALELAMSSFRSDANGRIVLLSDGQENAGLARSAAAVARSLGVEISTIALQPPVTGDEVLISNLALPVRIRAHEPFEVEINIDSTLSTRSHLVVTRNGVPVGESELQVAPGHNRIILKEQVTEPGLYEYEAVINSNRDSVFENNRYQAFTRVQGKPRVLHAIGEPGWGRYVSEALRVQGLIVEEVAGTAMPSTLHELTDYDLVVLNNVSGFDLSLSRMELLEDYVRDAGGGLINLGGDKSYSAGGYYGTPVERLLPVTMDVKTEAKIPTLAVMIVIDRSGSMGTAGKLVIAKAAALAAVEVLNPLDQVSVLAFDDEPEWSVPPSEVGDRRSIVEQLRMVASGGGTDLYLALREALRVMVEQDARVKHIIVLSDGLTDTGEDFRGLVHDMTEAGITVSTVAFGVDADRELMQRLAALGSGRHYFTDNPRNIPRIFTSETLVVSRDLLVEEHTVPAVVQPGEMLRGVGASGFPALQGYQRFFAKPAASVHLATNADDPLLVSWRYGLGRAVAFGSDLDGRWAKEWISWPELTQFIAQTARWTMRREATEKLVPHFNWHGSDGEIIVDALDRDDRFINGLDMSARVVGPDGGAGELRLEQSAPGRYRGEFEITQTGRYYFSVSGLAANVLVGPQTFGLAVPYSTEFLNLGVDDSLLTDITTATGGEVLPLSGMTIADIAQPSSETVPNRARVWWPFVLAVLLLLLAEVMIRKLVLPDSWQRLLVRYTGRTSTTIRDEPEYEHFLASIARMREQHLDALERGVRYFPDDPAVRARLYLSSRRL